MGSDLSFCFRIYYNLELEKLVYFSYLMYNFIMRVFGEFLV
jgi:hypothetical protein